MFDMLRIPSVFGAKVTSDRQRRKRNKKFYKIVIKNVRAAIEVAMMTGESSTEVLILDMDDNDRRDIVQGIMDALGHKGYNVRCEPGKFVGDNLVIDWNLE